MNRNAAVGLVAILSMCLSNPDILLWMDYYQMDTCQVSVSDVKVVILVYIFSYLEKEK